MIHVHDTVADPRTYAAMHCLVVMMEFAAGIGRTESPLLVLCSCDCSPAAALQQGRCKDGQSSWKSAGALHAERKWRQSIGRRHGLDFGFGLEYPVRPRCASANDGEE